MSPSLKVKAPLAWLVAGTLVRHAAVVCDGGRITFAGHSAGSPAADERIEVDGFLMPAVADRHVHVRLSDPGAVLLGGVAAVRDLAWPPDQIFALADASELPSFNGPLIRAAGPMLTARGGYPTGDGWAPPGTGLELEGPAHAARAVAGLADLGAAAIKVSLNAEAGPTPSDAELAAIVEAAHDRELPVTAHVQGTGQAQRAVGAGIDEFAHTPWTERLSDSLLGAAARSMRIVSTLDILSYGEVTPELRTACDNLVRFRAAGGTVVYGTDLGQRLHPARHPRARGPAAARGGSADAGGGPRRDDRDPARPGGPRRPDRAGREPARTRRGARRPPARRPGRARGRVVVDRTRAVSEVGPPIVGREAELATLDAFLAATGAGPAALVIEGEAGAGKTTLWAEAVRRAGAMGGQVLTSSPSESEARLSFQGLADLLGPVVESALGGLPPMQRRALEVALLLSEPESEPADQRTVAAGILGALRELAAAGPVLLAIDEVQWLDAPSDAALAFAARRLGEAPVSALLAKRVGGRKDPLLATTLEHRGGRFDRLPVGPLSDEALHDLIQLRLRVAYPHRLLERIGRTSGGNPFFALELATALTRRAEPPEPGDPLPVPETLRGLVRERLDDLPTKTRDLLAAVSALSEPTMGSLAVLGAKEGAVDEAVRAGVIEVESHRVRFTHPLLASGAYDRLGPQARRVLHRRLAAVTEGEERARHLALGETGPESAVATELQDAARHAAARGAIAAAAELAEQSVRLTPAAEADVIAERRLEAAGYEVRAGDTERARANLEPLFRDLPPGTARARVMLRLARLQEAGPARALEICRQAIEEAGPDEAVLAAEARQLSAEMSMLSGDVSAAIEHARVAAGLAEDAGDSSILVECLGTLCHYETYTGAITPGLLERAVELECRQPRPSNNYSPREILGLRLMYSDRLDEARELLEASYATAAELGDELDRASLLIHLAQLECRAGRLAEANRNAREAEISIEQAGAPRAAGRFVSALARAHLGQVKVARSAGEEGVALATEGGSRVFLALNRWALGFLELSLGDALAANRRLGGLPEELDAMGYWNPGVRPVYADAAEARIGAGELDVDPLIDELERRGESLDNPWARAAAARCRGLLLAARGDMAAATAELERALLEHERSPQPLERGRTLLALGSVYRRKKRRADARRTLTLALELFDNLGAPLWAERAAAELGRIPGRGRASGELSETERRVAELVAEGLSNKEIASRLFVTVRTVEANLSKVYAKLGIRSRTELASLMSRQDET